MRPLLSAIPLALGLALPASARITQDRAAPVPAATDQEAGRQQYEALSAEFEVAFAAWRTELTSKIKEARENGEELPESAYVTPASDFLPRFKAGAAQYAGSDDAVPYLIWIVQRSGRADGAAMRAAIDTLVNDHVESPDLEPLASVFGWITRYIDGDTIEMLTRVEEKSSVAKVRQWARYGRSTAELKAAAGTDGYTAAKDALIAAAEATGEAMLIEEARSNAAIMEKFADGLIAPDITGVDLDGTAFSLSDYEGKVIFLDFWGDW